MLTVADKVKFVSSHILMLPYDDRPDALALVRYWGVNKRMSQLQQVKLERFVIQIRDASTNKRNKNDVVRSTQHGRNGEADST